MDKIKLAKENYIQGQLSGSSIYSPDRVDVLNTTGRIDPVDILVIIRTCIGFTKKELNVACGFHSNNSARITQAESRNGSFGAVMQQRIINELKLPEDIFTSSTALEVFTKLDEWVQR